VTPGICDALISHVDFHASFAALTSQPLDEGEAPDSLNLLDVLLGRSHKGRADLITQGTRTRDVLRQGNWVLIPPHDGPARNWIHMETGNSPEPQLYDLSRDIGQIRDLAREQPERVQAMTDHLQTLLATTATRPC